MYAKSFVDWSPSLYLTKFAELIMLISNIISTKNKFFISASVMMSQTI